MSAVGIATLLPLLPEFSSGNAERWIAASLAEAAALREHDGMMYPSDSAKVENAKRLHAYWRQWADDAEAIMQRVRASLPDAGSVNGYIELRKATLVARARIAMTPETMMARCEQMRRGEVYPIEEVRGELRLEPHR